LKFWIVSEGEPIPIDDEKVRLRRMGQLANVLVDIGHEVHWFCSTFHHYKKLERYLDDTDIAYKKNYYFHLFKGEKYKNNVSISRILHHKNIANKFSRKVELLDKPDVIIATMAPLEFSEVAVKYAKNKGVPVVVDIRDLWPEIYNEVVPVWAKKIISPYISVSKNKLKRTLLNATGIIGVTPGFLNYGLEVAGISKRNTDKVFHTSYRINQQKTYNFDLNWNRFGIKETDFIVAFMGNFGKQFNIEPIVKAAEKLKKYSKIKFVLCGLGERFDYFKELTIDLENVIMPGWIEGEQIKSLLQNSKIGLAPYKDSINFSLNAPNKFGEYLSYRLPVFLSINGEMENLVNEYSCGMVYLSYIDLAEKIEDLFLNINKQKKMSEGAFRLYKEKFDSDIVYKQFADYLISIANED
jgi:glycosyltransferase involved in cell wall biosynthesis